MLGIEVIFCRLLRGDSFGTNLRNVLNEVLRTRKDGSSFYLKLRQNRKNTLDFSAILGYSPKDLNTVFKLIRFNGKSHEHRNVLEKETAFYDFHIHKATERYQFAGRKEEFFAETTDRYSNLRGALRCLIADCNVSLKENPQLSLSIT